MSKVIYWEPVNPVIRVDLAEMDGATFVAWSWNVNDKGTWDDGENYYPEWSKDLDEAVASSVVRDVIAQQAWLEYAVFYGTSAEQTWRVALAATNQEGLFSGLGLNPPSWWEPDEKPLKSLLVRALRRLEIVKELQAYPPTQSLNLGLNWREAELRLKLNTRPVEGFCSTCGLPDRLHVPHYRPIDADRLKEFIEYYKGPLRNLTDDELLQMPLPRAGRYLKVLIGEIRERLSGGGAPIKSRLERLLDDSFSVELGQ